MWERSEELSRREREVLDEIRLGLTNRLLAPLARQAPQARAPQGWVPFLHDHLIGDVSSRSHGADRGNELEPGAFRA